MTEAKIETAPLAPIAEIVSKLKTVRVMGDLFLDTEGAVSAEEKAAVVQEFRDQFPGASDELLVRIAASEARTAIRCGDPATASIVSVVSSSIGCMIAEAAGLG